MTNILRNTGVCQVKRSRGEGGGTMKKHDDETLIVDAFLDAKNVCRLALCLNKNVPFFARRSLVDFDLLNLFLPLSAEDHVEFSKIPFMLGRSHITVSRHIDQMVESGLLEKRASTKDRRMVLVKPTHKFVVMIREYISKSIEDVQKSGYGGQASPANPEPARGNSFNA